jgi:hypothetical protein
VAVDPPFSASSADAMYLADVLECTRFWRESVCGQPMRSRYVPREIPLDCFEVCYLAAHNVLLVSKLQIRVECFRVASGCGRDEVSNGGGSRLRL